MGAKKLLHLFGFPMTSTLNDEYLLKERDIDSQSKALKSTKGLLHWQKIS